MILWHGVILCLSTVQTILTMWLAFDNCDLKAENETLRARLAALEAPPDYLAKENDD